MEKQIEFLEKLNQLTKETGIIIDTFGVETYDPSLATSENFGGYDFKDRIYISYDPTQETYVGRKENPYDGEVVFPIGYVED